MKVDGCRFVKEDYQQAVKEIRVYATLIAEDINVETFEPGYYEQDKRHPMPTPLPISLKLSASWIPQASPSSPPRQIAPKPNVERSCQVDKSTPERSQKA